MKKFVFSISWQKFYFHLLQKSVLFPNFIRKNLQLAYLENDEEGLDGVAEDDTPEELPLLEAVPVVVDDLHLLDNGGLARLPRPQQQQLDLPVHLAAAASCLMTGSFLAQVVAV